MPQNITMSKQRTIIPAHDLRELYGNLEVYDGLSEENLAYYVPLFEAKIKKLEMTLAISNAYNDTFFLLGQTGTGKTTVVDYLFDKSEALKSKYVFVSIDFLDDKSSTNYYDPNFNTIELFLIVFTKVFEIAVNYLSNDEQQNFIKKLKAIEEKQLIQYQDTVINKWSFSDFIAEGLLRAGALLQLGLNWNIDMSRRETIRVLYQNSTEEVLDLLNELLAKTQQRFTDDKVLFLFLDGLEKLRSTEVISKIFNQENTSKFKQIQCRKLIVKPIDSATHQANTSIDSSKETLICTKVSYNPLDAAKGQPEYENLQQQMIKSEFLLFKEILQKRIAPASLGLVEDIAITLAIKKSGGILSDYLEILKNAIIVALVAESKSVNQDHVESACTDLELNKSGTFATNARAIKLLYHVLIHHECPENTELSDDVFLREVLINNIIIGKNGVRCFYVHPLIQKTVEAYGRPKS